MVRFYEEFPLLKAVGLKATNILGDGNCLFNAFSDQIYGHQKMSAEIRESVVNSMRENSEDYKGFVAVDDNLRRNPKRKNTGAFSSKNAAVECTEEQKAQAWEGYLERMARNGVYGDNLGVRAFGQAYNMDVKIFRKDFCYFIRAAEDGVERPMAYIALNEHEHYSSVRNIDGPFTGLPEVREKGASGENTDKAKAARKNSLIHDWMVKSVSTSIPHLGLDDDTIRKRLAESNGDVDETVSKLLEAGYTSSGSASPGGCSQSGSSSVERDLDSDDEEDIQGPNKKQNRRILAAKSAAKLAAKNNNAVDGTGSDLQAIPSIELMKTAPQSPFTLSPPSQLPPTTKLPATSKLPGKPVDDNAVTIGQSLPRRFKKEPNDESFIPSDDENDGDFEHDEDDDAASSYSVFSVSGPNSIATKPNNSIAQKNNKKSMQKQAGPTQKTQKKPTARDRKESQKAAQKLARKERKLGGKQSKSATPSTNTAQNRDGDSPPIQPMTTLYI